ncbi:hypothetical protein [Paraglaciecola sp. L1A13]|uniref:hypothetical protein n=1 Tax=Paraglaciecola sp. L1A13 TaxID=2686359 RepID=UPI00131AC4D5|nr:hypothetical protein [Paraglaciecola sp. L1A13]
MDMKQAFLSIFILLLAACGSEIPEHIDLKWHYENSIDVARFKVVQTIPVVLGGSQCDAIVWELESVETFKGKLKQGDKIRVWGPNDPTYWALGKDRIMFLDYYQGQGYDSCSSHLFSNFKQVTWGGCEISTKDKTENVLFHTMINSEQRGDDIPVASETVFNILRSY